MYTALLGTSETLANSLQSSLAMDIPFFADGTMQVTLNTPQEMTAQGISGVSIWLYQVIRDDLRLNEQRRRVSPSESVPNPLPLRLHYLVTPIVPVEQSSSPETEQVILGRILQCMHDNPILRGLDLQGDLAGSDVQLHVRLESLGLEGITRIWEALDRSYQLSVSYELSVVEIASRKTLEFAPPVSSVVPEYAVIVGKDEEGE